MSTRRIVVISFMSAALLLPLASCGDDTVADPPDGGELIAEVPVSGGSSADRCDPSVPDCDDTVGDDLQSVDEPSTGFDPHLARADAQYLLGLTEDDLDELAENGLADDVRVGRRGGETFALIENYVNGRKTVELDARDGVFVVTSVTVELPDGPETFTQ